MCGVGAEFRSTSPEVALTLFCSMPGGSVAIAEARDRVEVLMHGSGWRDANFVPPSLVLAAQVELPLPADSVYIGIGSFGPAGSAARVTQWVNPFEITMQEQREALLAYKVWLDTRMDLADFARPLLGKSLVCDCGCAEFCHGSVLIKLCEKLWLLDDDDEPGTQGGPKLVCPTSPDTTTPTTPAQPQPPPADETTVSTYRSRTVSSTDEWYQWVADIRSYVFLDFFRNRRLNGRLQGRRLGYWPSDRPDVRRPLRRHEPLLHGCGGWSPS